MVQILQEFVEDQSRRQQNMTSRDREGLIPNPRLLYANSCEMITCHILQEFAEYQCLRQKNMTSRDRNYWVHNSQPQSTVGELL